MVSDVPVGAFLSGGLDSSAVVRFAREQVSNNELDCFTIAFDSSGGEFDGFAEDLPYAKRVARELDVPLHVVTVGPDMATRFGEMIYHLDEPQADPAPLNALFICELARDHGIKVLLSGAGGDDLFTGYRRHAALRAERLWAWLPLSSRRALRNLGALFPQDRPFGRRVERAFRHADSDPVERLVGYFLWIDEHVQRTLYTPDFEKALGGRSAMAPLRKSLEEVSGASDPLDRMLYLELRHFLADHNLNYTDKTGMAAGVEVRVPFLDPELVEYASKIPASEKFRGRTSKYLLKKAMEPYLPRSVIYRPKSGFGVPLRKWLHGRMRGVMLDLLSEKSLKKRGLFDANRVKQLIDKDFRGETDAAYPLFSLMCIEWWQRIFLDETG
jgi:asparagine synthase (glutamine-hydrolysing)